MAKRIWTQKSKLMWSSKKTPPKKIQALKESVSGWIYRK